MSEGDSTTQISERSRRGSLQNVHSVSSVRLKHSVQKPTRSLTTRIASASASASSGGTRSRWNASRCAVRCPTPGSRASCVTSASTAGESKLEAREPEPAEPARDRSHALLLQRGCLAKGLRDRCEHHVLQQLDLFGV